MFVEAHDAGLWEYRGIAQLHTFSVLMHWAGASKAYAAAFVLLAIVLVLNAAVEIVRRRSQVGSWNP